MDRPTFASSLPFLIPLQSTAWPPVTDSSSSSKILIGDYYHDNRTFLLSMEVQHGDGDGADDATSRPAFFKIGKESDDKGLSDPAASPIQVVVVENLGLPDSATSAAVYLRVDGHVYALDVRQANRLEVVSESYETEIDDDDDTSYRRRKVIRPCSLLLQFDSLLLRIFCNNLEACREDKAALTLVWKTLSDLENTVFRVSPDDIASPGRLSASGSSGSATVDLGRKDESPSLLDVTPPTPVSAGAKRPADSDPAARIQRHRAAFHECVASLAAVRHVLNMPASLALAGPAADGDHGGRSLSLGAALSRTAHLASQSFVSQSDLVNLNEHYETLLQQNQNEMEQTLCSFFPAPHRGGRARYGGKKDLEQQPQVSGATAATAFVKLMEQQKRIVEERHKLLLLPTRG